MALSDKIRSSLSTVLSETFSRVRESCAAAAWSRGVEAARSGLVTLDGGSSPERLAFRVLPNSHSFLAQQVTVWPDEGGWECSCGGSDPCEHVAAAVIAGRNGQFVVGEDAGGGERAWRIRYAFKRVGDGLVLERWLVGGSDKPHLLETTLRQFVGGMQSGRIPRVTTRFSPEDFAIDGGLEGSSNRGPLRWIAQPLSRCPEVTLDDIPVTVEASAPESWLEITDEEDAIRVRLQSEAGSYELFRNGLMLAHSVLSPAPEERLTPTERERFGVSSAGKNGTLFLPAQREELYYFLTEELPALAARISVRKNSRNIPECIEAHPRLAWTVEARGNNTLWALAELVYGEPPYAAVRRDRLVFLPTSRASRQRAFPIRNRKEELRLSRLLMNEFSAHPGTPFMRDGESALAACQKIESLQSTPSTITPEQFRIVATAAPIITTTADRVSLQFSVKTDDKNPQNSFFPAETITTAFLEGRRFLPHPTGIGVVELPTAWLREHIDEVRQLLAELRESPEVPPHRLPAVVSMIEEGGGELPSRLRELADLLAGSTSFHPDFPADASISLRDYQQTGWEWLMRLKAAGVGCILADDMGLGKTIQALLTLEGRCLIVCPTSVLHSWAHHLAKYRPALSVTFYHGQQRELPKDSGVVITSYGLLRRDVELFADIMWDCVILDESQAIKNPVSQTAQAAYRLQARWRVAMTGTPVENTPLDLWSQCRFAIPGLLPPREIVEAQLQTDPEHTIERIKRQIRPFLLRRTKAEVLSDLPPKTEITLRTPLRDDEQLLYNTLIAAARKELLSRIDESVSVMAVLEAILRLRQACCDMRLVKTTAPSAPSSKIETLLDSLEEAIAGGHRCLIFSQWVSMLDLVEKELETRNLSFLRLDGSTANRGAVVDRFQATDGPPLFLISLKAGGVGLTLTAADHVFVLDPWWNPAVEEQATDRAHRIGQKNPVFVYRLIASDTIEERILELQERKKALARTLLGDSAEALSVSREELLELLG